MNKVYHVGISGGKDSTAALLWIIHRSGISSNQIDATFCDTGNEHEWTYEHIRMLSKKVFPIKTLYPDDSFFDLAFRKHRFPSTKARFCTQFLKIYPSHRYLSELHRAGKNPIAVSGVRADESKERGMLSEFDVMDIGKGDDLWLCTQWRPLLKWKISDVLAIHAEHGVPLNPLYEAGARRVGCFPCIMSRKSEIRMIALKFPERIAAIREQEQKFEKAYGRYSSFFPSKTVPLRFRSRDYKGKDGKMHKIATIDDVVSWSMTGRRAKGHYDDPEFFKAEAIGCKSGFCE